MLELCFEVNKPANERHPQQMLSAMIPIWIGHALKYFNSRVHAFNDEPFARKLFAIGLLMFAQRMKLVYPKISKIHLS